MVPWSLVFAGVVGSYLISSLRRGEELEALKKESLDRSRTIAEREDQLETLTKTPAHQLGIIGERLHSVNDTIRDEYQELGRLSEGGPLSGALLESMSMRAGAKIVNYIAELFSYCSGHKICACLKIFDGRRVITSELVQDLDEESVLTFCRSANTPHQRYEHLRHPVRPNTAFRDIILGVTQYFKAVDLEAAALAGNYNNTTVNWSHWYKTAIVVPIRIAVARSRHGTVQYDTLGFLCADSASTSAFGENNIDHYAHLLMSVGDGMYHYFDRIFTLQDEPGSSQGSDQEQL